MIHPSSLAGQDDPTILLVGTESSLPRGDGLDNDGVVSRNTQIPIPVTNPNPCENTHSRTKTTVPV